MDMNPWLMLGPAGMVAVGLGSISYWRRRSHAPMRAFLFGGLVWAPSVAPKSLMDLTVTPMLSSRLDSSLGSMWALAALGLYVGVRTDLFECGATYLAVERTRLRDASLDEATAFGVGFGATEAVLLGLPSLIQMAAFLANPSLIDAIPPEQRALVISQLGAPTYVVFAPIMERAFTLFAHLFAALLIFSAVQGGRSRLFLLAFLYKTVLDAPVPYIQWLMRTSATWMIVYLAEVWVALMGATGLVGSIRQGGRLDEISNSP